MSENNLPLDLVENTVEVFHTPCQNWRQEALVGDFSHPRHTALREEAPSLQTVRVRNAPNPDTASRSLKVVAWNLERCKHIEATAEVLKHEQADIVLATEMDLGMARSGNRDTTADLADLLGMGHVFATEFIELGMGTEREKAECEGVPNIAGLHGNAILTRLPIDRALMIPLDDFGFWYTDDRNGDQRRIGGRNAVAVRHAAPVPFWVVAVHYESRLGPVERAEETRILLTRLAQVAGNEPVLVAGDFNCKAIAEHNISGQDILERPDSAEPMFSLFQKAGYDWQSCNTAQTTTRNHSWSEPGQRTHAKIDWFFANGLSCKAPALIEAVDENGTAISDHEAIAVTIDL